jgi:TRAP-type C4-dicarboxylate transport system permease large subunit
LSGAAVAKLPIEQVVRALYPFFGALLLVLAMVTYIPALSLWLPGLLLNK